MCVFVCVYIYAYIHTHANVNINVNAYQLSYMTFCLYSSGNLWYFLFGPHCVLVSFSGFFPSLRENLRLIDIAFAIS